MAMKKTVGLLLCCLLVLTLFACTGKGTSEMDASFTVEDTKAFVIKNLENLRVLRPENSEYITDVPLGDSEYKVDVIYLARTLHVYELAIAKEGEVVLTVDEVIDLYDNWDAQKGERLEYMGDWYSMNGRWQHSQYTGAISEAHAIYIDNEGEKLYQDITRAWPLENLLTLEEYTRQNPDLENDSENYQQLLIWLGVVEVETASI